MNTRSEARSAHVRRPAEGESVWFLDNLLTIKVSRQDGAPFGLLENAMPVGSHTPMHAHDREDEAFYVLEGTLRVFFDDRVELAGPGTYLHIPAGVVHGFRTETPVRMLVVCGGEGFVEMAREAGSPAQRRDLPPASPPDEARLARACAKFGIRLVGPLPDGLAS